MRKMPFLAALYISAACHPPIQKPSITLDAPKKGYWFLSEKFAYQFMRVELYDNHVEGLPSLTMEFRTKVESAGVSWKAEGDKVQLSYKRPESGTVTLTPVTDRKLYRGRYQADKLALPLIEVKLGKDRKVMYYTEDEAEMDRLLREKNKLRLDVVWGPTLPEVIEQMFRFTHPTSKDIMFDLGCGDARILIAAARRFGTRGIGYDLDPKLIERGNVMARQQKVSELITLRTENLFAADLSSATIIAIYLSDRINSKLKPKFFRELKPGTQIVSHNWHMGDWQPDGKKAMEDKSRVVYYWVIPANLSGIWEADGGAKLTIHQHYQIAELQLEEAGKTTKVENIRIQGSRLLYPNLGVFENSGETLALTKPGAPVRIFRRRAGSMEPFSI